MKSKQLQEKQRLQKNRFGEKELKLRSLHLSDLTQDSDELMGPGEMGDLRDAIGPKDFPGIETNFEPVSLEHR